MPCPEIFIGCVAKVPVFPERNRCLLIKKDLTKSTDSFKLRTVLNIDSGDTMTRQRQLIYEIICQSDRHMTAEQIYLAAKRRMPSIAMGTVYRNLGLMVDAGEIRRVVISNEPDRFDRTLEPHHHMICARCGQVTDVALTDMQSYLERQTGVDVVSYDLSIRYICSECQEASASGYC